MKALLVFASLLLLFSGENTNSPVLAEDGKSRSARTLPKSAGLQKPQAKLKSYSDEKLLKLIFPDINKSRIAHKSVAIANLHEDFQPVTLTGDLTVSEPTSYLISNGKRRSVAMIFDLNTNQTEVAPWGGLTLLALFRLTPVPKLLDVVDLRQDRECGIWSDVPILHAGDHDSFVIYHSHLNAGEEFLSLEIVEIQNDKFVLSKTGLPLVYSGRGGASAIEEQAKIIVKSGAGRPGFLFRIRATAKRLDPESGAEKSREVKVCQAEYIAVRGRWRERTANDPFKQISQMEKRYGFGPE